jgi:cell division ATPase FtsA
LFSSEAHNLPSAGVSLGLINDIPTCQQLVDNVIAEAEDVIIGLRSKVVVNAKL